MSWAAVAKKEPEPAAAQQSAEAPAAQTNSTAVIDANAIIAGMRMDGFAQQLCTIPEVLQEIRDRKSREILENFPHNIKTIHPTEESIKAGASRSSYSVSSDPSSDCASSLLGDLWLLRSLLLVVPCMPKAVNFLVGRVHSIAWTLLQMMRHHPGRLHAA